SPLRSASPKTYGLGSLAGVLSYGQKKLLSEIAKEVLQEKGFRLRRPTFGKSRQKGVVKIMEGLAVY
ncbi:MAG: hypothetical protein ACREA3_00735, partial [Nitrosotalea sp.]